MSTQKREKRNRSVKKSSADVAVSTNPSSLAARRKRISIKTAILHIGSLFLMFAVFLILSINLANRTLTQRNPTGGTAELVEITQAGEVTKTFNLDLSQAKSLASIIDTVSYESFPDSEKLGTITLTFVNSSSETYTLMKTGLTRSKGWSRHQPLSESQLKEILATIRETSSGATSTGETSGGSN